MQQAARVERPARIAMAIIRDVLGDYHPRDFAVRLWDGTTWGAEPGQPARFTLVLNHPGALRKMLLPPMELALGEAYIYGDFDVEGDMEGVYLLGDHYRRRPRDLAERFKHAGWLLSLPRRGRGASGRRAARQRGALHSRERDQQAVSYHYDTSNEFFSLWLDERMVYTCAYFETPQDDLATAQLAKLDYVCRKLRLQPGERLLDIGCGWGGLVIHAAREYGVEAVGVTLSQAQADLARERIRRAGLAGRCRVEVCDYRDVREPGGYDKLVSVGMFEQVGETRLGEYFEHAWDLLRPGGVFLNHGISCSHAYSLQGPSKFILRYVFPDGGLVPISTTLRIAEEAGFEVRDVESLREHYILTLRHWVRRLESCREEAVRLTDEVTYRVWRLYMSASANGFRVGRFNLHQALLLKPEGAESGLPLRRADWYARGP